MGYIHIALPDEIDLPSNRLISDFMEEKLVCPQCEFGRVSSTTMVCRSGMGTWAEAGWIHRSTEGPWPGPVPSPAPIIRALVGDPPSDGLTAARSGIDWQIYSVGFIISTERFRYVHQRNKNDCLRFYGDPTNSSGTAGVYTCLLLQVGLYAGLLRCCGWGVETKIHHLADGQGLQDFGGQCLGLSAQG